MRFIFILIFILSQTALAQELDLGIFGLQMKFQKMGLSYERDLDFQKSAIYIFVNQAENKIKENLISIEKDDNEQKAIKAQNDVEKEFLNEAL